MDIVRCTAAFAAIVLIGACREPTAEPAKRGASLSRSGPSFAVVAAPAAPACPTGAAVIPPVTDEASLGTALSGASPGAVIALGRFFEVTADVIITTPDVTLTCATPGAGIFAQVGSSVRWLLQVRASGVTVDRLVLDGGNANRGPYVAGTDFASDFVADAVRFTNNTVTCGSDQFCAFFAGTRGAIVTGNHFEAAGSQSGVHVQVGGDSRQIDGSRVEHNTIVAMASSGTELFGGIRVRDGRNVVVANNVVRGPWLNSIAATNLAGSLFENNRLEGAGVYGIRFGATPMNDNVFRNNQVTGAGSAGIFAQSACRNLFVGNNLQRNTDNVGLIFDLSTGANTVVGNQNVVVDAGIADCGPNVITGRAAVKLGQTVSDAVVASNRLR